MSQVILALSTIAVSTALIFYFVVITYQIASPIATKLAVGVAFADFSFPALFQNLGVAAGMAGATFRSTDLLTIGVLLIALALLIKNRRSPELQRAVEIPLLVTGLLAFGLLGLVHTLA